DHIVAVRFHVLAVLIELPENRALQPDVDSLSGRFVLLGNLEFHLCLLTRGCRRSAWAFSVGGNDPRGPAGRAGFGRAVPPKTGVVPAHATSFRAVPSFKLLAVTV